MNEVDYFRDTFKFYKRKCPSPNFNDVIDFNLGLAPITFKTNVFCRDSRTANCLLCHEFGLKDHMDWDIYGIQGLEGFLFIKNPFLVVGQQKWIRKCLELYPRKPAITNLDFHFPNIDDIWTYRNIPTKDDSYLNKLCWTTVGYHHNWDSKQYDPGHYSPFPDCLKQISLHIARNIGSNNYHPDAAIINYYNTKSSLGIHNDHSEEAIDMPILSYSFGQSAIFLIGTNNRCEKPTAMFVRSGDIVVMSGHSRLSYHAVPCIISENESHQYYSSQNKEWEPFEEYIGKSRINVSVRQVYRT